MIKIENTVTPSPEQWKAIIMGTRNPMNSWERSDTMIYEHELEDWPHERVKTFNGLGDNDYDLMMRLAKGGPVHAKYRRMITVYATIAAPLYWWKEFDTYRVGVAPNPTDIEMNSCSTMHKIHAKEFTLEDFSTDHLFGDEDILKWDERTDIAKDHALAAVNVKGDWCYFSPKGYIQMTCNMLNRFRQLYLETKDKKYWWQMIQLLPTSYNQKRTVMLNYEVLANIYKSRKDHKLDEWAEHKEIIPEIDSTAQAKYARPYKEYFGFCDWIKTLPFSELITGEDPVECEV